VAGFDKEENGLDKSGGAGSSRWIFSVAMLCRTSLLREETSLLRVDCWLVMR
jgi:hypothetical protein